LRGDGLAHGCLLVRDGRRGGSSGCGGGGRHRRRSFRWPVAGR
jgi:hypothetical protein